MQTYEFSKSVVLGDVGENRLLEEYPYLIKESTEGHDIIDPRIIRVTIEVKTDFFDMARTPNFFMERYSDDKTFKLGGPWRADAYNTDVLLYQFLGNKKIFWFDDIPTLVDFLDDYINTKRLQLMRVKNKRYYTLGFKIPRYAVKHLYTELNFGDELPT